MVLPSEEVVQIAVINQDMVLLEEWAKDNLTTFEPEKMSAMVFSQKKKPFTLTSHSASIWFGGEEMTVREDTTLVGLLIDQRMRWGPMVDKLVIKARKRIGALARVSHLLNSENMQLIYSMFIRSIMEYNSVSWMGAAPSHLAKLDRVQQTAERLGGFQVESL